MTRLYFICMAVLVVALVGCGQSEKTEVTEPPLPEFVADTILFDSLSTYEIVRTEEICIYTGDTLGEYLGQSLEQLKEYGLVGMAATTYKVGEATISCEIAQYETVEGAYGAYAILRPYGVGKGQTGVESFNLGSSIYVVNGEQVLTLSAMENDETHQAALSLLSQEIAGRFAKADPPFFFLMFPMRWKIEPSNWYFPSSYLGVTGLDEVFTTSYLIEGDTAVFFLTEDLSGNKFMKLQAYANSLGETIPASDSIQYYDNYSLQFEHPVYGTVVAGLVRSKVAGVIYFNADSHLHLTHLWVKGLQ